MIGFPLSRVLWSYLCKVLIFESVSAGKGLWMLFHLYRGLNWRTLSLLVFWVSVALYNSLAVAYMCLSPSVGLLSPVSSPCIATWTDHLGFYHHLFLPPWMDKGLMLGRIKFCGSTSLLQLSLLQAKSQWPDLFMWKTYSIVLALLAYALWEGKTLPQRRGRHDSLLDLI